jgi:hypothetical protein
MAIPDYNCGFEAVLFRAGGEASWTFAEVPPEHAPGLTLGWGRTPVAATVDGKSWQTSVWREKNGRTLLAVPRKIRGNKDHGDVVQIRLTYSISWR